MRNFLRRVLRNPSLEKFALSVSNKFSIPPPNSAASEEEYAASLVLVDLLDTFFTKSKITLPPTINVLDAGAGQWHYAIPLYHFLSHYNGTRAVELHGIDIEGKKWQKDILKRVENHNIHYHAGDMMDLKEQSTYDLVFIIHMFPPYRFKERNIPFRPYKDLFAKAFSMLKEGGTLVGIAFGSPPEEYSFFDEIPAEFSVKRGRYAKKAATELDYLLGKDTFHNSMVMIARK